MSWFRLPSYSPVRTRDYDRNYIPFFDNSRSPLWLSGWASGDCWGCKMLSSTTTTTTIQLFDCEAFSEKNSWFLINGMSNFISMSWLVLKIMKFQIMLEWSYIMNYDRYLEIGCIIHCIIMVGITSEHVFLTIWMLMSPWRQHLVKRQAPVGTSPGTRGGR